jgi:galactokinase
MDTNTLISEFKILYGDSGEQGYVYFSPGRVNLIGEHTDYNGGFVFPCALSFGTFLLIRKSKDDKVKFASVNQDFMVEIALDKLTEREGQEWVNYPLGVIDQFIKKGIKINSGYELLFWGNVPTGAGLSSSASIEVVTAYALNELLHIGMNRTELALLSQKAENEFVGVNCGIMDQFASAMGKEDHAIFLNCDTLEFDLVPAKLDGIKVIISNTNSPHKLDAGQYNQRVAECKEAVKEISKVKPIKSLGELRLDDFKKLEDSIDDPVARKRARHVVSEIQRTVDAVSALKANEIETFGEMMNASHVSLRDDYEVTGEQLDTMAEEAWKLDGVIGSRMTGAGFGGCTVSLVKEEAVDTFIDTVGKNYKSRTGLTPEFYVAEIGDGSKFVQKF